MSFDNDEIRNVLARASQIEQGESLSRSDIEALMAAAEEVGIPRAAVERAVRERLALQMKPPVIGQLTFARSADDKYYVAEVVAVTGEAYTVRFIRGSEHTVGLDELKPCSFLPGERVVVNWPWWGPWTCTVLSYDRDGGRVTVTDGWGETRDFGIGEVWLAKPRSDRSRRKRFIGALLGAASAGAAIGAALTSFLIG